MARAHVRGDEERCFAYNAKWHDAGSGLTLALTLLHWPHDDEVELIDAKKRKKFLKRIRCGGLGPGPLRPGSSVLVMSRRLTIISPADAAKHAALSVNKPVTRTFAMVKPDAVLRLGGILTAIAADGRLAVTALRMARLSTAKAAGFYAAYSDRPFYPNLMGFMTSGPVVALQLEGEEAMSAWRALLGPADPAVARRQGPHSLRAAFGTDATQNACHGSDSPEAAAHEAFLFFGSSPRVGRLPLPRAADLTLAIVKPHAIVAGLAGRIIEIIQERFTIVAAEGVRMSLAQAEEFHAVYTGVVPPPALAAMTLELSSGLAIALAVARQPDSDGRSATGTAVEDLRTLAGPGDPDLARAAAPGSLRARFGVAGARNAVHVTDLPQDGRREAEWFFGAP